jgi:hypothetical protein
MTANLPVLGKLPESLQPAGIRLCRKPANGTECATSSMCPAIQVWSRVMKMRIFPVYVALLLLIVCATPCVAQIGHFAVASSANSIYIVREGAKWGSQSAISLYSGGTSYSGIAVQKDGQGRDWVFAADTATGRLTIGRLENVLTAPSLSHVRTVDLGVTKPTSIAVDKMTGGVYVIGNSIFENKSKYAYVTPSSGDWTGAINVAVTTNIILDPEKTDPVLDDIASLSTGGAIIADNMSIPAPDGDGNLPQRTHFTSINESSAYATRHVSGDQDPSSPSSISILEEVATNPLAYITSHMGQKEAGVYGTLEVVDVITGNTLASVRLDRNFDPWDTTMINIGGQNYLSIIGLPRGQSDNSAEAWRIPISATGLPIFGSDVKVAKFSGEKLGGQKCAVSADGLVYWSAHPGMTGFGGTVSALSAADWTTALVDFGSTSSYGIANIAAYEYTPEPSSLAALAGLTFPLILRLRRRR